MRRLLSVAAAVAMVGGLWLVAPGGSVGAIVDPTTSTTEPTTSEPATSEATTTTTTTVPATIAPATIAPATRGTVAQVAPTLPPPTTTTIPRPPSPWTAPANSGTGRRVVYSKSQMRVWIIEADNYVSRSYRVSGRLDRPAIGTYSVFSRSAYTCAITAPNTCMRWMVRFAVGSTGNNIGFHEIPRKNGVPVQSENQLGMALSSGCVRQGTADAWFMWNWAGIGTKVVVIR